MYGRDTHMMLHDSRLYNLPIDVANGFDECVNSCALAGDLVGAVRIEYALAKAVELVVRLSDLRVEVCASPA